jgi:hypothetical protein
MSKRKVSEDSVLRQDTRLVPKDLVCPSCGAQLGAELHDETWIEVPIDGGWVLAYRMVKKGRRLVVAEGRVFPDERGKDPGAKHMVELRREGELVGKAGLVLPEQRQRTPGAWSGKASSVPTNGIPGEVLKELRLTDPREVLPLVRQNLVALYGKKKAQETLRDWFAGTGLTRPLGSASPGRPKLTDLELAELARDYVAKADAGVTNVIVQLAEKLNLSSYAIRSRRRAAIRRGILTPANASLGRANGWLTPKGKRILRQAAK